jgi:hypothetical protein
MPEKLEEIMKKFHIYLANCKESAYSGEDIIVSRKRILTLLEELNQAVYEVSEQYEATQESKARALMNAERQAAEIKDEALNRSDDIYAASMIYTDDAINQIKNSLEYTYLKVRREYEELLKNYEEKMKELTKNSEEISAQLSAMSEGQLYLRLIEQAHEKNKSAEQLAEDLRKDEIRSKVVGTVESVETLAVPEDGVETDPADSTVHIEVHDAPKVAEFTSKSKKKKDGFLKIFQKSGNSGEDDEEIKINEEAVSKEY